MKKVTLVFATVALAAALVPTRPSVAAFPGANGAVAYTVYSRGQTDICVVDADGRNPRALVSGPGDQGAAAWSPDGAKLAYTEFHDDAPSRIKVLDIASGVIADLGEGAEPAWAPSGTQLAFTGPGIWVMDADGSDRRQIDSGDSSEPAWSPDGTTIAFFDDIRDDTADDGDIWGTTPQGAPATHISDYGPASWSPDGTQLVADGGYWSLAIVVMNADGTEQRTLVRSPDLREVVHGSTWSPDGTKIAYIRSRALASRTATDIWTIPAGGGKPRPLLKTPNPEFDPAWQPVTESTPVVTGGESCIVPLHERSVTFRLRDHLVATGRVVSDAATEQCAGGWIRIRRGHRGEWTWLAEEGPTSAEGHYRIELPDRPGYYRVTVAADGDCDVARSVVRSHRH